MRTDHKSICVDEDGYLDCVCGANGSARLPAGRFWCRGCFEVTVTFRSTLCRSCHAAEMREAS